MLCVILINLIDIHNIEKYVIKRLMLILIIFNIPGMDYLFNFYVIYS